MLNLSTRTLTRNGEQVPITTGEFSVLKVFARHPKIPLSRDKLMELARGREYEAFDRSLDVQISRLRKLIEPNPSSPYSSRPSGAWDTCSFRTVAVDRQARPGQERSLVPLLRKTFRNLTSRLRLGLFGRTFLLLAALMLVSLGAWLQVFFSMELGPRANQMAQRVITAVNITRTALIYSHDGERSKLLLDLATNEGIQVYPREVTDYAEALPDDDYWQRVAQHIRTRFGPETQIAWGVNQVPGFWVSFQIEKELYWLVFEREQIGLTGGIEWLGWGATALLLSLVGAAVSVGFVNRPLSRLARAARCCRAARRPRRCPSRGRSRSAT